MQPCNSKTTARIYSVLLAIILAGLSSSGRSFAVTVADGPNAECRPNEQLTLRDYLDMEPKVKTHNQEMFKEVPKGTKIVAGPARYEVPVLAQTFILPSEASQNLGVYRAGWKFLAPCSVEGQDGEVWVVFPNQVDGVFTYTRRSNLRVLDK